MIKNKLEKDVSKFISSCDIKEIHEMYLVNLDLPNLINTLIQQDKSDIDEVNSWLNGNTDRFPINSVNLILDSIKHKPQDEKESVLYRALNDMRINLKEFVYLMLNPINFVDARAIALELSNFFDGINHKAYQSLLVHVSSVLDTYNSTHYRSIMQPKPKFSELSVGDEIVVMENYTNYEIKVSDTIKLLNPNNIGLLANDIFGGNRLVLVDYDSVLERI